MDDDGDHNIEANADRSPESHHHHHHHQQQHAHGRHHVDEYDQQQQYDNGDEAMLASEDDAADVAAMQPSKRKKSKKDKKRNRDREHRHHRSPTSQLDGSPVQLLDGGELSDEASAPATVGDGEEHHDRQQHRHGKRRDHTDGGGTPQYERDEGQPDAGRVELAATPEAVAAETEAVAAEADGEEAGEGGDGEAMTDAELELRRAALLAQLNEQLDE